MERYDAFAADYEWLFDDEQLTGRPFVAPYEHVLAGLAPGSAVLDAACGIGVEAFELARRGFAVTGTDASEAMVAQARARAAAARLDVPVETCTWEELPDRFPPSFPLVLCNGNSLVHASDRLVEALRGLADVLGPNGRLVIGTRNFEHLRRERPGVVLAERVVRRHGVVGLVLYSWEIPRRWDEPHVANVHVALVDGDRVTHRQHAVRFVPYRRAQLADAMGRAGLEVLESDHAPDAPRYTIVAGRR